MKQTHEIGAPAGEEPQRLLNIEIDGETIVFRCKSDAIWLTLEESIFAFDQLAGALAKLEELVIARRRLEYERLRKIVSKPPRFAQFLPQQEVPQQEVRPL